jgi:hypothetical protein
MVALEIERLISVFRRILAAALIAASVTAPAWAKPAHHHAARHAAPVAQEINWSDREIMIMMEQTVTYGAHICNTDWLSRDGVKAIAKSANAYNQAGYGRLMIQSMKDVDFNVKTVGLDEACKIIDQQIAGWEKTASPEVQPTDTPPASHTHPDGYFTSPGYLNQ